MRSKHRPGRLCCRSIGQSVCRSVGRSVCLSDRLVDRSGSVGRLTICLSVGDRWVSRSKIRSTRLKGGTQIQLVPSFAPADSERVSDSKCLRRSTDGMHLSHSLLADCSLSSATRYLRINPSINFAMLPVDRLVSSYPLLSLSLSLSLSISL